MYRKVIKCESFSLHTSLNDNKREARRNMKGNSNEELRNKKKV
jgi:hypothetical protein